MAISTLCIEAPGGQSPLSEKTLAGSALNFSMRRKLRDMGSYMYAIVGGVAKRTAKVRYGETFADGQVTFTGASGTVGCVIGGVSLTFTHGASDTADATTMASTINGSTNPLIQDLFRASSYKGVLTLSTALPGAVLTIMDTVLRAVKSGAAAPEAGEFAIGASDTLTAVNLVAAVNNHPVLRETVVASNAAGVVSLFTTAPIPEYLSLTSSGSGFAVTSGFVLSTTCNVVCLWKGTIGNHVTFTASGTGVAVTGSGRLTSGTNGTTSVI